ncbi:TetR family transcriptional regulator [Paraburkholderia caballeronis]|uniref:TetR/AcrR family transcriptional regulator n=1 Tax=Paraburkholderia caballeronis TaxID=416943 RepID=UPI001064FDE1|nr:TetR/AcrR family transcriptional regulator [Paraburkholderia caballeronis]TDV36499.1 TetR family transcriptional regulator [Paraburkholderia caballeronis]
MRVSRAQAEENRQAVIESAGQLFRQHGFDGVGLSDLMGAVGLTQGGFYKQFKSKDDLAVQACDRVLAVSAERLTRMVDDSGDDPLAAIVSQYLSCTHRDRIGEGCIFPALGTDAARHSPELIRSFEAGIRSYLEVLDRAAEASSPDRPEKDPTVVLSTMVGALLLSRLVEDEALSRRILDAATRSLIGGNDSPEADAR